MRGVCPLQRSQVRARAARYGFPSGGAAGIDKISNSPLAKAFLISMLQAKITNHQNPAGVVANQPLRQGQRRSRLLLQALLPKLHRRWFTEKITLLLLATEGVEKTALNIVFDPFGDHRQLQRFC